MKKNLLTIIACLLAFSSIQAQKLETEMDSLSYSVGVLIGQNLKQQGLVNADPDVVARAIGDVLKGNELQIKATDAQKVFKNYMMAEQAAAGEKNLKEGQDFLASNGKREGVTTTKSGLQYEVIQEGTGESPEATDKVTVHYHGTLINGTVFDSSVERGQPASFPVNGVIKGWVEGLQLMSVGAKWKFFIPANLAYGERGAGGDIGPNAALIFEVELLGIN